MKQRLMILTALLLFVSALPAAQKTLDAYNADVEGTRAMLVVTPAGQAVMVDAGWVGPFDEKFRILGTSLRDTNRILDLIKLANVKQIDYFVVSHWDNDHCANVSQLVSHLPIPVLAFVDHGEPVVQNDLTTQYYKEYLATVGKAKRIIAKPGDHLPLKGVDIVVVSSNLEVLKTALPGAGAKNSACGPAPERPDRGENPASLGLLFTFGKFKMIDLADLTKGKEYEMMCPDNRVGMVDLFIVSHHGYAMSNSPALVHAIAPRAAIMANGAWKGSEKPSWEALRTSPRMEDVWQIHFNIDPNADNNPDEKFIANPQKEKDPNVYGVPLGDQGKWIKASALPDGTFTIYNSRNGFTKTYKPKK
jgi:competence protein ComEC